MSVPPPQNTYTIGGVKVLFPVKPYPSQMAMMAQIVKGLQRRQNCLLESPTGSGKSLALLCSALAWQRSETEKAQRYNSLLDQGITDQDILDRALGRTNRATQDVPTSGLTYPGFPQAQDGLSQTPMGSSQTQMGPSQTQIGHSQTQTVPSGHGVKSNVTDASDAANAAAFGGGFIPEDDDVDFRSQVPRFRAPVADSTMGEGDTSMAEESFTMEDPMVQNAPIPRRLKVPKIFFGTRTHKQIYQIVKELRRTAYGNIRTCVLSSREHTCIHPTVSRSRNKNEGCRQLLDPREVLVSRELTESGLENEVVGTGCRFNHGVSKIKTHDQLAYNGVDWAWDIEDLVTLGRKIKACPYYAARSLKETAQIIFCPYNYLIDPLIRDSMEINLANQIVILDEAHNIEDSAREAASCTLPYDDMLEARGDLEKMIGLKINVTECTTLVFMMNQLIAWIDTNADKMTDYTEFDRSGKIFTGTETIASLQILGIGYERYPEFLGCLNTLTADPDPSKEEEQPRLNSATTMLLKSIFLMFRFLYIENMKYKDDYRVALVKAQTRKKGPGASGWFSKKATTVGWSYSINFWCLNPGVAFSSLGANVRSIILTSGTLSPMSSFQSELSVPFKIQLEANHVIDRSQVWVGTIGKGPTEQMLQATYAHTETWSFQDELGRLVLEVCKTVPRGVLCFLPSYAMLNKLLDRWQNTGLWDEINQIKVAMTEPRKGEEFEEAMTLFYDTIINTRNESDGGINGAFFMAVCRGKVSEGLDFTDDNARAVIAVGIPFPSIKDIQVDLKRKYNTYHSRSRGLLSGSDWYEIQAYRAINQALGRCIRHRYDWGALILVDQRFQRFTLSGGVQENRYTRGLSKWVRNKVVHYQTCSMAMANLRQFAEYMTSNPPKRPEESSDITILSEKTVNTEQEQSSFGKSMEPTVSKNLVSLKDVATSESAIDSSSFVTASSLVAFDRSGLISSTSVRCSDTFKKPNIESPVRGTVAAACKDEEFNSTIVGGSHMKSSDNDDCVLLEDFVPPSGAPLYTSTQKEEPLNISSQRDNKTLHIPRIRGKTDVKSLNTQELKSNQESPIRGNASWVKDMSIEVTPLRKDSPPAKRRKSFGLGNSECTASKLDNQEFSGTGSCFSGRIQNGYEFKYVNLKTKTNVSPLKMLVDDAVKENIYHRSPVQKAAKCDEKIFGPLDNYIGNTKKNSIAELNADTEKIEEDDAIDCCDNSSPQMFGSDDDLFPDDSPVKFVRKQRAKPENKDRQTMSNSSKQGFMQSVAPGNDSSVAFSEKGSESASSRRKSLLIPKKLNLSLQDVPDGDDSDLDDFKLDQSFSRLGEKPSHQPSQSKRRLSRRKGVDFIDFDE